MDRELVERARGGDHAAFTTLVDVVGDRLMGTAFRILGDRDRAEDAVQATIIAAWQDLPVLRDPDRFEAWVGRMLVHACYSENRRRRRHSIAVARLPETSAEPDLLYGLVARDTVERAFRRLPLDQRVVIVHRYYLGLSIDEIADVLGVARGTVKSRLHYATRALRASVDADTRPVHQQEVPA